eukprot:COSAG06_NODE_2241_length_7269_cov_9.419944_6_plen_110_part_00
MVLYSDRPKDKRKGETERCVVVNGQGKAWAAFSAADSAGGTASPSVCKMTGRANAEEEDEENPAAGGGGGAVDASDEASSAVRALYTLLLRAVCACCGVKLLSPPRHAL